MGGNVIVQDVEGNDVPAQKIDLVNFSRATLCVSVRETLLALNSIHKRLYGKVLWDEQTLYSNGAIFNGSSSTLFDPTLSNVKYVNVKRYVGDIDVTVPVEFKETVWELLNNLKGKRITEVMKYIGSNRPNYSKNNHQINTVFQYDDNVVQNIQIDFEFVEYVDGFPSKFAKFAHNSTWIDMVGGIKGVHHKYLLRALAGGASARPDIIVMTPKATPEKPRVKKLNDVPRMLKFSVDRGLRVAYRQQFNDDSTPWVYEGKPVYKEIPINESKFITEPVQIFEALFGNPPKNIMEHRWFYSFSGMTRLMEDYLNEGQISQTINRLISLYWGKGAQGFERNDPSKDLEIKNAGFYRIVGFFHWYNHKWAYPLQDEFYSNYRISESIT